MISFSTLKEKIRTLKKEALILPLALADSRTPLPAKLLAAITLGYLLSPIDLIPDFIPVLGWLDDLLLVPLLIMLTIKLIPADVMEDIRQSAQVEGKLRKKWYFALPVIFIYLLLGYLAYERFWP